ncbi:hypothetical protein SEA_VANLEE_165 [Gordonia phage VanLee]|uniref:Uncharacterized protein n=1 Tax=Gordonia phage VanLee TaxID=2845816 RepID=A0A8F2IFA9_9CAUD|nr:hypothetical protein QEH49_gp125 [Gordonia phage VanLee]QWS68281.1 hypothetical protein SEA_VANLEE_165 [Gordonia phage VanLee]
MPKLSAAELKAAMTNPQKRSRKKEPDADSKYTAEEKAKMDAEGKGLSGAAKSWEQKFLHMSDAEYWLTFCFYRDSDIRRFVELAGLGGLGVERGAKILAADGFLDALGVDIDQEEAAHKKVVRYKVDKDEIKRNLTYKPLPDPFADVRWPEDLEEATKLEIEVLADLLRGGIPKDWLAKHGRVDDYPHWFAVIFADRPTKEKFLRLTGIGELGADKYLDGYAAAAVLGLDLPMERPSQGGSVRTRLLGR